MPIFEKMPFDVSLEWLGRVPHRNEAAIVTEPLEAAELTFAGVAGETHGGLTRPACSRVRMLYPRETPIKNARQISIVSTEELARIAEEIGLETLDPAWLGATMVISGIPDFSHVPPSSRLQFESGATLVIDLENQPCKFPALTIEREKQGHVKAFPEAAKGRRGVVAWVEREGPVSLGARGKLFVPTQRAWRAE